jgi:hypothetical protein
VGGALGRGQLAGRSGEETRPITGRQKTIPRGGVVFSRSASHMTGGLPPRIAAKVPRAENRYFKETIKPLLDQNNVEFVGEVNDRQKQAFLGNAAAGPAEWQVAARAA